MAKDKKCPQCNGVLGFYYNYTSNKGVFCSQKCEEKFIPKTEEELFEEFILKTNNVEIARAVGHLVFSDEFTEEARGIIWIEFEKFKEGR